MIAMDMFDLDVEALRKAKKAARQKVYREANKEKKAAYDKAWREANKEKIAAKEKAYREANKAKEAAYNKAYREANKEKLAAQQKAYRETNKQKILARQKSWHEANKEKLKIHYKVNREKILARTKAWREINKEKISQQRAQRRFRKMHIINHLLVAQRGKCASCHANVIEKHHLDHIVPVAKGGTNDRSNFQLLCPTCNLKKSAKDPLAFMQERGKLC